MSVESVLNALYVTACKLSFIMDYKIILETICNITYDFLNLFEMSMKMKDLSGLDAGISDS